MTSRKSKRLWILCCLGCLQAVLPWSLAAEPAAGAPPAHAGDLLGIWAGQRDFGPRLYGELLLIRRGSEWRAEIAGRSMPAAFEKGVVSFEAGKDGGSFLGRLDPKSRAIEGQWIQPPMASMFGQRFSTPVRLEAGPDNGWRGKLWPLADQIHLFVAVQADDAGHPRAFVRNPELNAGRFLGSMEVDRQGDRIRFLGGGEAPRTLLEGTYRPEAGVLSIFVQDLGGTFDLARLGPDTMTDFYPRSWARTPYRYRPPTPHGDGWQVADLGSVGMAVEPIEALVRKLAATPIDSFEAPYIDAVLIARRGKLVLEEYFHGYHRKRVHDTRSASKSLTSTLVGAVIHATGKLSLDTPVYAAMHGGAPPADLDPRAARMTLEHLLTMTPGFACDDWDRESPGTEDRMQSQRQQPDWYRFTLDLPMLHEPGEHAAYCSASPNLAGGVVTRVLGVPLTEIFHQYLAKPLDLGVYHTNLMPTGEAYAGGGLRINARDFLKFGQLMLDDGRWRGRQITAPGWSVKDLAPRHPIGDEHYGYGWWLMDYELGGRQWDAFYAGGNGGNYIIGVPELDLVVVFQASNYGQRVMHRTKYEDVPEFILRSVVEGAVLPQDGP